MIGVSPRSEGNDFGARSGIHSCYVYRQVIQNVSFYKEKATCNQLDETFEVYYEDYCLLEFDVMQSGIFLSTSRSNCCLFVHDKMETPCPSKTEIKTYQTTMYHIPEDNNQNSVYLHVFKPIFQLHMAASVWH
jgi:hypothetical protein